MQMSLTSMDGAEISEDAASDDMASDEEIMMAERELDHEASGEV
jgi:hypothetical protein